MKKLLLSGLAMAAAGSLAAVPSGPAQAVTRTICPTTSVTNPATTPPNCNEVITFNADGSVTTTIPTGATANYDGSDDALIGVVNSTGHAITSFHLSSSVAIFGFDGDGIDLLALPFGSVTAAGTNTDATGYGGFDAFFTGINASSTAGNVNFANGGIDPNGGTDFFSLEQPIDVNTPIVVTPAPEPLSIAALGAGLVGLAFFRRGRRC
jgi:hypothetical protein